MNSEPMEWLRAIGALGAVVGLAYWALKYVLPKISGLKPQASGPIKMVARFPLEPNKTLYLVQAGDSVVLLGTSENSVQYLTSIESSPRSASE